MLRFAWGLLLPDRNSRAVKDVEKKRAKKIINFEAAVVSDILDLAVDMCR